MRQTRQALAGLLERFPQPWVAGLEATIFSPCIYDHIRAQVGSMKVAHSMMLKAIAAGKRKNDRVDARKIAELLRCDYFPECHMAGQRSVIGAACCAFETCLARQAVRMKNKVNGLLMETGIEFNKGKLHQKRYGGPLRDRCCSGDPAEAIRGSDD